MQKRALLLTDAAIYNTDTTVEKLKRRVPLENIASVTADESSGQFVLHAVVRLLLRGQSGGYDASEGGGAAATSSIGVIDALQRAYTSTGRPPLPVRTHRRRRRPRDRAEEEERGDARISRRGSCSRTTMTVTKIVKLRRSQLRCFTPPHALPILLSRPPAPLAQRGRKAQPARMKTTPKAQLGRSPRRRSAGPRLSSLEAASPPATFNRRRSVLCPSLHASPGARQLSDFRLEMQQAKANLDEQMAFTARSA